MRNLELLVTALLVALFVLPASLADASVAPPTASAVPSAKLSVSVGVDPGGNVRFAPATILIPQVNLTLNVTFYNNYTTPGMNHTFTIFNADMTLIEVSTGDDAPGGNASIEFHINTMTNITYRNVSFTPEATAQGIRWFCIPHRQAGLVGEILLAGFPAPGPQKGNHLRAYLSGLTGVHPTQDWAGLSFFVLKSSAPHQQGQRQPLRE